jgi:uncharacterized protein with gpF-like domain
MARYLTGRSRTAEQRQQSDILDRIEARFQPALAREIARTMRVIARGVAETGEVPPLPEDHQRRMGEIVERAARVALRVLAGRVLDTQRSDAMVIERKDFADTVRRLSERYIRLEAFRRRIVRISETTRDTIVTQVERGFAAGLGQEGVARMIRQSVPEIARYRSRVIARTETHGAAGYGAHGAARETGLTLQKEWVAAEDERTRETHAALDGTIVGMDDYFDVGGSSAQYPGDPALPPEESINCRCVVAYIPVE